MTEKRHSIREVRGIKPARMSCKKCGGQVVLAPVSIRFALFALRTIGAADKVGFKELDREWTRHRKLNGLDAYGSRPE